MCHCLLEAGNNTAAYNSKAYKYSCDGYPLLELHIEQEELFVGKTRAVVNTEIFRKLKQELLVINRQIKLFDNFLLDAHASKVLTRCVALLFRCCFALFRTQETTEDFASNTGLFFLDSCLFKNLSEPQRSDYVTLSERCIRMISNFLAKQIKQYSSYIKSSHDFDICFTNHEIFLYSCTPFVNLFQVAEGRRLFTAKEFILRLPNAEKARVKQWNTLLHNYNDCEMRMEKFRRVALQTMKMVRIRFGIHYIIFYRMLARLLLRSSREWWILLHRLANFTTSCFL